MRFDQIRDELFRHWCTHHDAAWDEFNTEDGASTVVYVSIAYDQTEQLYAVRWGYPDPALHARIDLAMSPYTTVADELLDSIAHRFARACEVHAESRGL